MKPIEIAAPPTNYIGPIPGGVHPQMVIRVQGKITSTESNFSINLLSGPSRTDHVVLHLNPRFARKQIVRNSRFGHNPSDWGDEERDTPTFPFILGHFFEVVIVVTEAEFELIINGQHFANYKHRTELDKITHLWICGEDPVYRVRYENCPRNITERNDDADGTFEANDDPDHANLDFRSMGHIPTINLHNGTVLEPKGIAWVEQCDGSIPNFAVLGGVESGKELFIARAHHETTLTPGKIKEGQTSIIIGHYRKEYEYSRYQVLVAPPNTLNWVESEKDIIPKNSVEGGYGYGPTYPTALFIGRVMHNGHLIVGKVHPPLKKCYVTYGGTEQSYEKYEILVKNMYGQLLNV